MVMLGLPRRKRRSELANGDLCPNVFITDTRCMVRFARTQYRASKKYFAISRNRVHHGSQGMMLERKPLDTGLLVVALE
jgi:hypothetical protein